MGVQITGLPFSHGVDLVKLARSSKSQFPHLQNGTSQVYVRNNQDSVRKHLHIWKAFHKSHLFLV